MLADKTTYRYFTGGRRPKRWCCRFNALRLLLIDGGLIVLPPIELNGEDHAANMFVIAASGELLLWDELGRSPSQRRAYLRYVCANVIGRLFSLLAETDGASPLLAAAPAWAKRSRRGEPVRRIIEGVDRTLTNGEHAKRLGCGASTLSAWKTGKTRPPRAAIEDLAAYAARSGADRAGTRRMLHWHYALSEIAEVVRRVEGDDFVAECARVVTQAASCLSRRIASAPGPKTSAMGHLLVFPLWKHPELVRDTIIEDAVRHGAPSKWSADVRSVCEEYAAISKPDEVVTRALPKHKHPAWRLPRKLAKRYGASIALAAVRDERRKRR